MLSVNCQVFKVYITYFQVSLLSAIYFKIKMFFQLRGFSIY